MPELPLPPEEPILALPPEVPALAPSPEAPALALPPEAPTLADAVAQSVRDGVAAGELVPERTYSVYQLAELLGVSRSPVREGLLRLAEAGLVEIIRNRGFRVLPPRAHDIEEIIGIRLALEPPAARQAAEQATDAQRAAIRAALGAMATAAGRGDEASFWPADRNLHDLLLHASGKPRTAAIVAQLRSTTALLGPPTTTSGRTLTEIHAEHEPVVTAVLARAGAAAEAAMRTHLEATRELLIANAHPRTSGYAT